MNDLSTEITMELVTDLETAIKGLLSQILPTASFDIEKFKNDKGMGITLTLHSEVYPRFITLGPKDVVLRPTNAGRIALGIPILEER